jgi:hypothetical protein
MYIQLLLLLLIKIILVNGNIRYNTCKFFNVLQLKNKSLNSIKLYNKTELNINLIKSKICNSILKLYSNGIKFNIPQFILNLENNDDIIFIITSVLM